MSQDDILNLLNQKEELTFNEIEIKLKLSRSTISSKLGRLRKKKLIEFKRENGNQLKILKYKEN